MYGRLGAGFFVPLVIFFALPFFAHALDADPCPGKGRIATAADLGYIPGAKICPSDQPVAQGGCEENPYPFLEQRHTNRGSQNSILSPLQGSIGKGYGTNATLACRLKKLLEAMEKEGCQLTIRSAMRPRQNCTPGPGCAPQGASCHQYGLAVDLNGSVQCLDRMTQIIGRNNPNSPYKLHVAYKETSAGYRHVQCSENLRAGCSAQTQGCGGPANVNPNPNEIPVAGPPSAPFTQRVREILNPPPPNSLTNTNLNQGATLSNPSNPLQFFPTQSPGVAPTIAPPTTSYIPPITPATIIQTVASGGQQFPTTTVATSSPISTSTAEDLRNNVVTVRGGTHITISTSSSVTLSPSVGVQQTFPDYQNVASSTHASYQAGTFATLYSLMTRVEELLAYLQPFRGAAFGPPAGSDPYGDGEHLE